MMSRYFTRHYIFKYITALFLFGCTLELCARCDDKIKYGAPVFGRYNRKILLARDSEGIPRNVPGSRFEKWQINAQGFRGEPVALKKAPGVNRIVCMGTSESFGLYEDPKMEWPAQLNHMLQDYRRCEVINASVVGLGIEYFIPYLRKYVLHLQPDTVILYVNPYFYLGSKLEDSNLGENNGPSKKDTGEVSGKVESKISDRLKPRSLSKIKQAVYQHIPQPLYKPLQIWANLYQVRELEERSVTGKNPWDVAPDEYLQSFELEIIHLVDFLKRHQAEVILSTYPSLVTEENLKHHLEVFLEFRRFVIGLSFKGMLDTHKRFNDVLRRVAAKTGVGLVDNARIVPSDVQYFCDNVHYTNKGATLVARSFADFILSDIAMASDLEINPVRSE